jgi:hypothetical protein
MVLTKSYKQYKVLKEVQNNLYGETENDKEKSKSVECSGHD